MHLPPSSSGKLTFTATDELGVYRVLSGGKLVQQFAVNLLDPAESNIRPPADPAIKIGYVEVAGKTGWVAGHREIWRELVLAGLAIACWNGLSISAACISERWVATSRNVKFSGVCLQRKSGRIQWRFSDLHWGCMTAGNFGIRPPHGLPRLDRWDGRGKVLQRILIKFPVAVLRMIRAEANQMLARIGNCLVGQIARSGRRRGTMVMRVARSGIRGMLPKKISVVNLGSRGDFDLTFFLSPV